MMSTLPPKITVLIVDDHKLVRNGIRMLLKSFKDLEVLGEAESGQEALSLAPVLKPSVILMDVSMPNLNGIETAALLLQKNPEFNILFLSMHEEPEYVIKSIKNGGKGYVLKNVEREELALAIRTVAKGEKYFSTRISQGILNRYGEKQTEQLQHNEDNIALTQREKEILKLLADGLSAKEIGDKLFISPRTVETHRVNIMKKLDATNTAELIKLAVLFGLVEY